MTGQKNNNISVRTLALVGVLSALVFALSSVSIQIGDVSRVHFGNIMCLLAGLLFGPVVGGVSAGLGSMLYDFSNPLYISEFWITFITKFAMGFVAGLMAKKLENRPQGLRLPVAALSGSATYLVLYVAKSIVMQRFYYGNPWDAVWPVVATKAAISGLNGLIAVVASVILAPVLRSALNAAGLFKPRPHSAG